ncbi:MAG: glycosyltransferase family 4 protein [Nitrospirota bacterium]
MKIAVVGTRGFPGIQGGVETHCENLYTYLAASGCDITVYGRKPYMTWKSDRYKGVKLIPVDSPKNKFLEAIVHTFRCILMARKLHPDIVHIHAIGPSLFAPLARLLGMKVVVTHHGPDYMRKKWPLPAKIFLKFCERMGMMFANQVIVIARNISDDIKLKYNRDSAIIPNGVEIRKPADTADTFKKYGIEKRKYILCVGRFVPEKGFHDLIEAYNLNDFGGWKLVIVGDADHEDSYSRSLKTAALTNKNIVLTGFLTGQPLHELYSHAGIFVLPSYYEGLPIVLLEAMSYGLSCIASDIPANRAIELHDDRFVIPGDIQALSDKIKQYVSRNWGEEDREKQIQTIAARYNWGLIAHETLGLYNLISARD